MIAFAAGAAAILTRDEDLEPWLAVPFGVGMGLTLDESALLLELEDVYWSREGLLSVQITLAVMALLGALALGLRFLRRGEQVVLEPRAGRDAAPRRCFDCAHGKRTPLADEPWSPAPGRTRGRAPPRAAGATARRPQAPARRLAAAARPGRRAPRLAGPCHRRLAPADGAALAWARAARGLVEPVGADPRRLILTCRSS